MDQGNQHHFKGVWGKTGLVTSGGEQLIGTDEYIYCIYKEGELIFDSLGLPTSMPSMPNLHQLC